MHLTCEWNERNIGPQYKYLFILYKSWVIKYYVPILGLVLSLVYHAVLWVRSYNNNIAAWNAHTRPKAFFEFFFSHYFDTSRVILRKYYARNPGFASGRSSTFCSREFWTHHVHINQTDFFNPYIYSSQQTVVQRVY